MCFSLCLCTKLAGWFTPSQHSSECSPVQSGITVAVNVWDNLNVGEPALQQGVVNTPSCHTQNVAQTTCTCTVCIHACRLSHVHFTKCTQKLYLHHTYLNMYVQWWLVSKCILHVSTCSLLRACSVANNLSIALALTQHNVYCV